MRLQHDCSHFFGKDDMQFSCGGDRLRLFEKEMDRKKRGKLTDPLFVANPISKGLVLFIF